MKHIVQYVIQYLDICSPLGESPNIVLRDSIKYIGKYFGKLANKKGCRDWQYLKSGIEYIVKKRIKSSLFKKMQSRETVIYKMIVSKKIKNSSNRKWSYHRRIYGEAYGCIIATLFEILRNDKNKNSGKINKDFVEINKFLNNQFQKNNQNNNLEPTCSNALIFDQKNMLDLHKNDPNVFKYNREDAKRILDKIIEVDMPLP